MTSVELLKEIFVPFAAIWGAALSTFVFWRTTRKEARQLAVTMKNAFPTYSTGAIGEAHVTIHVVNTGHRTVTVDQIMFLLPDGKHMNPYMSPHTELSNTPLPITLADGQTATASLMIVAIAQALRANATGPTKLTCACRDTTGKIYKGETFKIDPAKWAGMSMR